LVVVSFPQEKMKRPVQANRNNKRKWVILMALLKKLSRHFQTKSSCDTVDYPHVVRETEKVSILVYGLEFS
jgi:hypothetical protein